MWKCGSKKAKENNIKKMMIDINKKEDMIERGKRRRIIEIEVVQGVEKIQEDRSRKVTKIMKSMRSVM